MKDNLGRIDPNVSQLPSSLLRLLYRSVLTGLCMSAPHHDTLKQLGHYVTCVVVFVDFNHRGLLLPVYRHPSGKPSSFVCAGWHKHCWFLVAKDGCSLTSCP